MGTGGWTRWGLVAWVSVASVARAEVPLRHLDRVELQGENEASWLAITTDRPANFTSFKLAHPSRIVIDFPETSADPLRKLAQAPGPFAGWAIESLGDAQAPVARLTVELRDDLDYTLTSAGPLVQLRLVRAAARPLMALANTDSPAVRVAAAAPNPQEKAAEERQRKIAAEREAKKQAAQQAEASRQRKLAEGKAAREAKVQAAREAMARAEEERQRKLAEKKAAREAKLQAAREAKAEAVAKARALREAKAPSTRAEKLATLDHLTFKRSDEGAHLTLKLSQPTAFTVREESGHRLVVELEGAHIPLARNRLPLDTRFFGTSVQRVHPQEARADRRVSVAIELADTVPYSTHADGSTLVIDFGAPPAVVSDTGAER